MKLSKQDYDELIRKRPSLAPTPIEKLRCELLDQAFVDGKIQHEILSPMQSNCDSHQRIGAYSIIQKPKENRKQEAVLGSKVSSSHGRDHPKYRVTIVWNVSDKRTRDNDGMLATIMDCLARSARRLAGMDPRKPPKRAICDKG